VFVALDPVPGRAPRSYVVPREHVWAGAYIQHMNWLTTPGIPAGKRNAGVERARVYAEVWAGYEDGWDLLNRPTTACPVLLPVRHRVYALDPRVGLPDGHPWRDRLTEWGTASG
jgi:hypothetical protein